VILLLGVRRIGKTSLLKTALSITEKPCIYIDARRLGEEGYSKDVMYRILSEEFTKLLSSWERIKDALKRVKGIHVAEAGIEFDVSRERAMLSSVFASLDRLAGKEHGLIVAVDEAQLLRNMRGGKGRLSYHRV